jgi:hypothetical protein
MGLFHRCDAAVTSLTVATDCSGHPEVKETAGNGLTVLVAYAENTIRAGSTQRTAVEVPMAALRPSSSTTAPVGISFA